MSIDNNGNLYLSGYMQDMFVVDEYNQYPMNFFLGQHSLRHSVRPRISFLPAICY